MSRGHARIPGQRQLRMGELVRHALDRGVTYFDTAESYRFGWSEEAMGEGLKGVRDRVVLSSKTKAGRGDRRDDMMAALEGSLKRLQTDWLDIYFNHAVNDVRRMQNQEWWEFTERARQQGKIRFRGMSGHGGRLAEDVVRSRDHGVANLGGVGLQRGRPWLHELFLEVEAQWIALAEKHERRAAA